MYKCFYMVVVPTLYFPILFYTFLTYTNLGCQKKPKPLEITDFRMCEECVWSVQDDVLGDGWGVLDVVNLLLKAFFGGEVGHIECIRFPHFHILGQIAFEEKKEKNLEKLWNFRFICGKI